MAFTKVYEIRKTTLYTHASSVYRVLPEREKMFFGEIIPKEVLSTILFVNNVLNPIEDYCDKFFDCKEKGFGYHLGCYFQKKEYQTANQMKADVDIFTALLTVYNQDKFPEQYELIILLVEDLKICYEKYVQYEECHPELFELHT